MSKLPNTLELGNILKMALPLAFGQLGGIIIGITDTLMLGRMGPDALGAVGLALAVYGIILTVGMGMIFPVIVLASQARGAGRLRTVPGIIRQGLWIAGILSVPACIILWNLEEILLRTGQVPDLVQMAGQYMDYMLWTVFPALGLFVFMFALTTMGRVGTVAVTMWLGAGINVILDYALIFGNFGFPAMGIAGAGLASVIVYTSGFLFLFTLLAFHRTFRSGTRFRRAWRPKWPVIEQFFRLGWPKSLEILMISGLFSVFSLLVGRIGVEAIAAHTIAFQISMVVGLGSEGIANAVAIRIGIASGGKDYAGDNLWRVLNSGLLLLFLFMLPPMVVLNLFPLWAVGLFVGSDSETQNLLPVASSVVVVAAFFIFIHGFCLVANRASNGLADMKIPALITVAAYWGIALPAGIVLGFFMDLGVLGIWWGLLIGGAAAAVSYPMRFGWVVRHASFKPG
uniref:Multidrug-efflux transporter n=1 Tax=Candidatus Kentrum sp. TUN TaxID=2126343 RepID=A0A451A1P8_9GAMM|nr:MAG: multidrug resistance protein, MATE family [Candidatus Kentron sp. TUN]